MVNATTVERGDGGMARSDMRGRERTVGCGFEQRRSVAHEARNEVAATFGQRCCRSMLLWHGRGTWQPRGDDVLTTGPGAERD
jgi:hypothetical protein